MQSLLLNQVSPKHYPLIGFKNKTIAIKWKNQIKDKWYYYTVEDTDHQVCLAFLRPFNGKSPYWVSVSEIESVAQVKEV